MSLPRLTPEKITQLQKDNIFCNHIITHLQCSPHENYFTDIMGTLHKMVIDFNSMISSVVIQKILIKYLLHTLHDSLAHVGATKLYHFIKKALLFSKNVKMIHKYVRTCKKCQIMNYQKQNYIIYYISLRHYKITYPLILWTLIIPQHRVTHTPSLQFSTSQVTLWQPSSLTKKPGL